MTFLIRDYDWREEQYEHEAMYGDPRVCDRHPNQKTSSPNGLFDTPCPVCEYEHDECDAERHSDEEDYDADGPVGFDA